jgi:creatinine amidohydrolase/Fe(II)-dependent formamide hydrolase-like protein
MKYLVWSFLILLAAINPSLTQVLRVADLPTDRIRSLERSKTVVLLPGGILEEHGPYLPAYTDGILSERLTAELADAVATSKPGWTVLIFPQIAVGSSGSNELGGHFTFPGSYVVQPSTLRSVFMDIASEIGEQGFRWIFVVHVHGAPRHIRMIDDACDFFHDTYGGQMVNLWGLLPVLAGWGSVLGGLTDAEKKEEGVSLHGGMDETSLMLHLRPDLVLPDYRKAAVVTGQSLQESFDVAKRSDWPGYLGSPRLASAELGGKIWRSFAAAATEQTLKILDGADPRSIRRYSDILEGMPLYQGWIKASMEQEKRRESAQRDWLSKKDK